jgi:DNA-binding transcriptional regulator YdaS (Cro superfamily)
MTLRAANPILVALAALAVAGAATAAAPSLSLSRSTVRPGQTLVVRGTAPGCPAGDSATIISRAFSRLHEFAGVPAVYARVRAGGAFQVTVRIPIGRRAGRYGITARCGGGNLGVQRFLRVL